MYTTKLPVIIIIIILCTTVVLTDEITYFVPKKSSILPKLAKCNKCNYTNCRLLHRSPKITLTMKNNYRF